MNIYVNSFGRPNSREVIKIRDDLCQLGHKLVASVESADVVLCAFDRYSKSDLLMFLSSEIYRRDHTTAPVLLFHFGELSLFLDALGPSYSLEDLRKKIELVPLRSLEATIDP